MLQWSGKPGLKSHRPKMKRLNQHRDSGYDKKEDEHEYHLDENMNTSWCLIDTGDDDWL